MRGACGAARSARAGARCGRRAGAAGVTITVTHELDAARPAAVIAVPFARHRQARAGPAHVPRRGARSEGPRRCRSQITNYQHDHRGAQYDDLVFSYDFAAGEKRATFTLEAVGHRHAARSALRLRAHRARALRRHGLGERSHRASHVRLRAEHARPRGGERLRGSGIDVWAQARQLSRSSIAGTPRVTTSSTRTRKAKASTSTASAARAAPAARASGTAAKLWTSDNFVDARRCCRTARGARHSSSPMRPGMRAPPARCSETKQFTVDCGRNFDAVESVFDFVGDEAVVGIGITEHPPAAGFPAAVLTRDPRWPLDELLGREQGRRPGHRGDPRRRRDPGGLRARAAREKPGNGNHLLLVKAKDGVPLRYFTGAGWNEERAVRGSRGLGDAT